MNRQLRTSRRMRPQRRRGALASRIRARGQGRSRIRARKRIRRWLQAPRRTIGGTRKTNPASLASKWAALAAQAGRELANRHPVPDGTDPHQWMNRLWNEWRQNRLWPAEVHIAAAARFVKGFGSVIGAVRGDTVLLPTTKSVAVVISVMNEEATLPFILREVGRLPVDDCIIVINGTSDTSFTIARESTNAMIVHYDEPLGHDVGRALGAKLTDAEMVVFLDGDMPVRAEQLIPFLQSIERGADVALNDIDPFLGLFAHRDSVTVMKEFLNRALGRADLAANSMTAVPHVLSRRAIRAIGPARLAVPPYAQALAIREGLKVTAPASVDVIRNNRPRKNNMGFNNEVAGLIIGDHVEALVRLTKQAGSRLHTPDRMRDRNAARGGESG